MIKADNKYENLIRKFQYRFNLIFINNIYQLIILQYFITFSLNIMFTNTFKMKISPHNYNRQKFFNGYLYELNTYFINMYFIYIWKKIHFA